MASQSETDALAEPLLKIDDVRVLFQVSRTGVYRLIDRGDLVPLRIGGRVRFAPSDVRAYLSSSREEAAS